MILEIAVMILSRNVVVDVRFSLTQIEINFELLSCINEAVVAYILLATRNIKSSLWQNVYRGNV